MLANTRPGRGPKRRAALRASREKGLLLGYEVRDKNMRAKNKFLRFLSAAALLAALSWPLAGCHMFATNNAATGIERPNSTSGEAQLATPVAGATIAVFETSLGTFRAQLFEQEAPQACANFIALAQSGYYDGLTVSRVEAGFIAEAGFDAEGAVSTIWSNHGYPAEVTDALHHYSGALCMAMNEQDKATSVFYVMETLPDSVGSELTASMIEAGYRDEVIAAYQEIGGAPYLDYTDTVFGQVYEGMSVVDTIAQSAADDAGKPLNDITIYHVTIEEYAG
jgi:peptidyl-prolyl cis-trans isomerase B (cyclophilin B)